METSGYKVVRQIDEKLYSLCLFPHTPQVEYKMFEKTYAPTILGEQTMLYAFGRDDRAIEFADSISVNSFFQDEWAVNHDSQDYDILVYICDCEPITYTSQLNEDRIVRPLAFFSNDVYKEEIAEFWKLQNVSNYTLYTSQAKNFYSNNWIYQYLDVCPSTSFYTPYVTLRELIHVVDKSW